MEDPVANAAELPDEYRVPVFQAVLANGGEAERAQLMDAYAKLTASVDQKHAFNSVGFSPHPDLKQASLRWSISGEVKIQDFFYVMMSVSNSSKAGLDMMRQFLMSEFEAIRNMVKNASPSIMDAVISASISGYCSATVATEMELFFEQNPLPLNKRTISQKLEEVRTNAAFLDRVLATDVREGGFWDRLMASIEPPSSSNL